MLTLPSLPYSIQKAQAEIVAMGSINYSDAFKDGDMADSLNLSTRRYPYISTRKARVKQSEYSNATALTAWDKLVVVEGTNLMYDGEVVGTVLEGEKQFAVVNTKLVIWPDKVYLDLTSENLVPLAASASGTGATFSTNTMTISWSGVDLTTKFKVGDAITISGCTSKTENNKDIVIKDVTATVITVSDNGFVAATESGAISIERSVPDLDFICESDNRLWGCSNEKQTLYASALGDPTNFNVFEGLSTDSYALAVGSEGVFTGCCKLSDSILFWKETKLHKLLGSYPAEYSAHVYTLEGLRAGCHKSLQVINETLFYMGMHGVYAFSGSIPQLISANFGNKEFTNAVGGNDGDSYYLSVMDGTNKHLFIYETRSSIWVHEDNIKCLDFARIGRELYMLTDSGDVYLTTGTEDEPGMPWLAQFTPFYETIQGRKRHSKISMRLELPRGSYLDVLVRFDGGRWKTVQKIVGQTDDAVSVRIPMERCDKFELKLEGKGKCTILSLLRTFSVGSEV